MNTSLADQGALASRVEVTEDELRVDLQDGRTMTVPLIWFPSLLHASPEARAKWELLGNGEGIRWPEADEDLSVIGLLEGIRPGLRRERSRNLAE